MSTTRRRPRGGRFAHTTTRRRPVTRNQLQPDIEELMPRRRHQQNGNEDQPIDLVNLPDTPTCIDLTDADDDEDVEVLHHQLASDSPILILSSSSDIGRRLTRRSTNSTLDLVDSDGETELPVFNLSPSSISIDSGSMTSNDSGALTAIASSILSPGRAISCPICLDTAREIRNNSIILMSTTCGHIFCSVCINNAIKAQQKCPTCRRKLTKKNIHPIFL